MYTATFHLPHLSDGVVLSDTEHELTLSRSWRNSEYVCAFADDERHFGHVIRTQHWDAYDATRSNEVSGGFKYLGAFADLTAAMQAVEMSVQRKRELRTMHAGAAMPWADQFQ